MSKSSRPPQTVRLEDSAMWRLAKEIVHSIRDITKDVPYDEHYTLAVSAVQDATSTMTGIATCVGRGDDTEVDLRWARAKLLAAKSVVMVAHELNYVKDPTKLYADIDALQQMIEKELSRIAKPAKESRKK